MNNKQEEIKNSLEDFWVGLSDDLDMNIYMDEGKLVICVYPVINGSTDISNLVMTTKTKKIYYSELGE